LLTAFNTNLTECVLVSFYGIQCGKRLTQLSLSSYQARIGLKLGALIAEINPCDRYLAARRESTVDPTPPISQSLTAHFKPRGHVCDTVTSTDKSIQVNGNIEGPQSLLQDGCHLYTFVARHWIQQASEMKTLPIQYFSLTQKALTTLAEYDNRLLSDTRRIYSFIGMVRLHADESAKSHVS
jgi:hypothetical protein